MSNLETDQLEEFMWSMLYKKRMALLLSCNEDWDEIDDAVTELIDERARIQKTIGELRGKLSSLHERRSDA